MPIAVYAFRPYAVVHTCRNAHLIAITKEKFGLVGELTFVGPPTLAPHHLCPAYADVDVDTSFWLTLFDVPR